jgi:inhibitor of cysteine peptidase
VAACSGGGTATDLTTRLPTAGTPGAATANGTSARAPIRAAPGQEFEIDLEANHTTGYSWSLAQPPDPSVVQVLGSDYTTIGSPIPGGGGIEQWSFRAVAPGTARIELEYKRPFETGVPPAQRVTYEVIVG